MKKFNFAFLIFILALQDINAKDTVYFQDGNPLTRAFVLWRVQFQPKKSRIFEAKVDSVLRGDFRPFRPFSTWNVSPRLASQKLINGDYVKMHINYLVLTTVYSSGVLDAKEGEIFPDTPKNRKRLSIKWDETIIIYKNPEPVDPFGFSAKRKKICVDSVEGGTIKW